MNPRWNEVAAQLVHYSTAIKPGERVMIAMAEVETYGLARAVYEETIKAGGLPQIQFLSEELRHSVLEFGNDEQIGWVPEIEAYGMEWADVYFGLRGAHLAGDRESIPADRLAINQAAMGKISTMRWEKTRWCLVRVPNQAFAQWADTSLDVVEDMFFNACLMDYTEASQQWHKLANAISGTKQVRIVGKGTDLGFSVEGRKWMVFDGKINMPDGEIYSAPVNSTLDGTISFESPGVLGGKLIHDIRLEWNNGKLVHASASTNEDFLHRIIETDAGSSRLGEFAFGMNPHLNLISNDILFDEKIGGTIHIALGRAYPECGGVNQSSIHWDIVKDLREEGTVFLDNKPFLDHGKIHWE